MRVGAYLRSVGCLPQCESGENGKRGCAHGKPYCEVVKACNQASDGGNELEARINHLFKVLSMWSVAFFVSCGPINPSLPPRPRMTCIGIDCLMWSMQETMF